MSIRKKALGSNHPDVAASLDSLAELYQDQGRYADAEPLYKRSLAIRERTFGPNHPDVANSQNNLATLYSDWFDEYRLYHRKDGRVHKEGDDLMSATRYAVMMLRHARTNIPPKPRSTRWDRRSWMSV